VAHEELCALADENNPLEENEWGFQAAEEHSAMSAGTIRSVPYGKDLQFFPGYR